MSSRRFIAFTIRSIALGVFIGNLDLGPLGMFVAAFSLTAAFVVGDNL
jgi:hypothetical protein